MTSDTGLPEASLCIGRRHDKSDQAWRRAWTLCKMMATPPIEGTGRQAEQLTWTALLQEAQKSSTSDCR